MQAQAVINLFNEKFGAISARSRGASGVVIDDISATNHTFSVKALRGKIIDLLQKEDQGKAEGVALAAICDHFSHTLHQQVRATHVCS